MKSFVATFLVLLAVVTAQKCPGTLKASGATFPFNLYSACFKTFRNPGVMYRGIGSGSGQEELLEMGKTAFAGSDSPGPVGKVWHVPTVGGGVVIAHSNKQCKNIRVSRKNACAIFTGKAKWSDLGCKTSCGAIKPVVRSDSSGTTDIFTKSLKAFCKGFPYTGKEPKWPKSFGKGDGNSGVARVLKANSCSIGYVGFSSAKGLFTAALQNKVGKYVKPSLNSFRAGLAGVKLDKNNIGSNPNPPGGASYPIVAFTYLLFKKSGNMKPECLRKTCLSVLAGSCQKKAKNVGLASLPGKVLTVAKKTCQKIK